MASALTRNRVLGGFRTLVALLLALTILASQLHLEARPARFASAGAAADTGVLAVMATSPRPEATILVGKPITLDPARESDAASAGVTAQLFETLTVFDSTLTLRPALASGWDVGDGGRRLVFHLRPGLTFSDGTPLVAQDVMRSWLRLLDPHAPSPLASLLSDVTGANDYRRDATTDISTVGLQASGLDLEVTLTHPVRDFPSIVASPSLAVVPPQVAQEVVPRYAGTFVGSGGYVMSGRTSAEIGLQANGHYWAGPPAIGTIHLVTDLRGRSPVDAFQQGDLDYAPIGDFDASWIAYDADLGPELRSVPALSVDYLGFDTTRPPFDDARVRRAIALAVDWRRIVRLVAPDTATPATSLVPPGVSDRSTVDFAPHRDVAAARASLASAGFPGGRGFPIATYLSTGSAYDRAILAQVRAALGIDLRYETMGDEYVARLRSDPPAMWGLSWVADYPGANDFLGVLLSSGAPSNYGRWMSPEFDTAVADAAGASTSRAAREALDRAETIVQRDVPVIPISYGRGWALSRRGLLGAGQNGLGIVRMAGLAWSAK